MGKTSKGLASILVLSLLGLTVIAIPRGVLAASPLLTNLVAYWKFDEASGNAADATGNGNTLTNNGAVPFSASYGKINNGVSLTGVSTYFSTTASDLVIGGDFTVNEWVNPQNISGSTNGPIYARFGSSPGTGLLIEVDPSTSEVKVGIFPPTGTRQYGYATNAVLTQNTWQMVTVVYTSSAGQVDVYLNGVLKNTLTGFATSPGTVVSETDIGNDAHHASSFIGYIDEVGVWNRTLTSTEVSELYNGGAGLQYPFSPATPTIYGVLSWVHWLY